MLKKTIAFLLLFVVFLLSGCSFGEKDSGDPNYEQQTITVEILAEGDGSATERKELSVEALRQLTQYEIEPKYLGETESAENKKMKGPYLSEVLSSLGFDLPEYEGLVIIGGDGDSCLLTKEQIDANPDIILAIAIDGKAKLDKETSPARLVVPAEIEAYWVKRIEKIILYESIPQKRISSVWIFNALIKGTQADEYQEEGNNEASVELTEIFSRFESIDRQAVFTMKSSDGAKKNEIISLKKSKYRLKYQGIDAPTIVSPDINLATNLKHLAWFSTNTDAVIFPGKMEEYIETEQIEGKTGVTLLEAVYEAGIDSVKSETFDLLFSNGELFTVSGADLGKGILFEDLSGTIRILWDKATGYETVGELVRIRLLNKAELASAAAISTNVLAADGKTSFGNTIETKETILALDGEGLEQSVFLSLEDLKTINKGYVEQCFSTLSNWPLRKYTVAKGIDLGYLLKQAGIKDTAEVIKIQSEDGTFAELTRKQLFGERYYYPNLLSGNTGNAKEVEPMLAWAQESGTKDLAAAVTDGDLLFLLGQKGLYDANIAASVQKVIKVSVMTTPAGTWEKASATIEKGRITLAHPNIDRVKLHYTLDGSEPTSDSPVYNPSTSYFQEDLNKPLSVSGSGKIKVKAIGYGKNDSPVLTYNY